MIGNSNVKVSPVIRNLGCFLDTQISLTAHVDNLRKTILFHIRNLWRIRRFIDKETCHHSVQALITSRLDYCNAVFTLLSSKDITRLQRLQNSAARLVFAVGRRIEAQPLLRALHWLPVKQRIVFKVLLYVCKAFNNLGPPYIAEQFTTYVPSRALRSLPWTHTVWWCQGPTSSSVIDVSLLLIDVSLLSSDEVLEIIKGPSIKSCSLDPLPASVFTKVIDDLLPTITQITNRSFNLASSPLT